MRETRYEGGSFGIKEEERSLSDLIGDLSRQTSLLLRQEMELTRVETSRILSKLLKDSAMTFVGLALAYAGLLGLIAAGIYGLATVLPWWASSLIIGGGVFVVGQVIAFIGQNRLKKRGLTPHHTFESVKEDIQWAKREMK